MWVCGCVGVCGGGCIMIIYVYKNVLICQKRPYRVERDLIELKLSPISAKGDLISCRKRPNSVERDLPNAPILFLLYAGLS